MMMDRLRVALSTIVLNRPLALKEDCMSSPVGHSMATARKGSTILTVIAASKRMPRLSLVMLETSLICRVTCDRPRNPANTCDALVSVWRPACKMTSTPSSNVMPTEPARTCTMVREPCWMTDSDRLRLPLYSK